MTNLEKMNELTESRATKEQIKNWAYFNRIHVCSLYLDEESFATLENSVEHFVNSDLFGEDEFKNWEHFLDSEFIE